MEIPWPLDGMEVVVVGAARTGVAASRFLASRGARVTLADRKAEEAFPGLRGELEPMGVRLLFGPHGEEEFRRADGIVLSPGVDPNSAVFQGARRRGTPLVAEIELASWFLEAPILAITGTNGKTTCTTLLGMCLEAWGRRVFVGGNIGNPLINAVDAIPPWEMAVVEVSSFQLEAVERFRPKVAALLNLTEDHLDRHPSFEAYARAKGRLFQNQGKGDIAVVNLDDPEALRIVPPSPPMELWGFTLADAESAQAARTPEGIRFRVGGRSSRLVVENEHLAGPHGIQNLMAASLCAMAVGCPLEAVGRGTRAFSGLEHRMEMVGEINGVRFVNDSKATNVGAVVSALAACDGPVVLIAGGKDKGIDFAPLREAVSAKARAVILLGEAAPRMALALEGTVPLHRAGGMDDAVPKALELASPGDTILLSPACSSFDQYGDYTERGRHFKEAFRRMARALGGP
jgi:UDP-N-acetylmuramoylalanine--D-glutamate ligase